MLTRAALPPLLLLLGAGPGITHAEGPEQALMDAFADMATKMSTRMIDTAPR